MTAPRPDDDLKFVALGGGSEVGRSCHILNFKGKTVMLDAGVHPAYTGMSSLPFYDDYDLSTVDILLISHFHLDHAASLPYVMQRTTFKGRVFMTHPTKAIYRWLLSDFVRVSGGGAGPQPKELYDDDDLSSSFDRIETIDFYSTIEVEGIKFTAYHAGHVLGAAMFLIEIAGVKVLFTGDYSREIDRHLPSAEVPPERPDILICESTYGTGLHQPRPEKEEHLTNLIQSTLTKGGRCLLPVFALGRAQELLLILDEYWQRHPDMQSFNIYYASSLARRCMAVYQTFINMMNDSLLQKFRATKTNPFIFKHIRSIRSLDRFTDTGPCVVLASPGMLQNGVSRQLLERWAPDPRNALIITGYSVEGTMAKQILTEPAEISSATNPDQKIPRRMSVEELSFAAHVDYHENSSFIHELGARHIILVHGETHNMGRLKSALLSKYAALKGSPEEMHIYNPRNGVEVKLAFAGRKIARAMGQLAIDVSEAAERVYAAAAAANGAVNSSLALPTNVKTEHEDGTGGCRDVATESPGVAAATTAAPADASAATITTVQEPPILVSGILVEKDFKLSLVSESDLYDCTGLSTLVIMEKQTVVVDAGPDLVGYHLLNMFGDLEPVEAGWSIMGNAVRVSYKKNEYSIEWTSSPLNDVLADSVVAVLLGVDSSKASVKLSSKPHSHEHEHEHEHSHEDAVLSKPAKGSIVAGSVPRGAASVVDRVQHMCALLRAQFGDCLAVSNERKSATVEMDGLHATVDFDSLTVDCSNAALKQRLVRLLEVSSAVVAPLV